MMGSPGDTTGCESASYLRTIRTCDVCCICLRARCSGVFGRVATREFIRSYGECFLLRPAAAFQILRRFLPVYHRISARTLPHRVYIGTQSRDGTDVRWQIRVKPEGNCPDQYGQSSRMRRCRWTDARNATVASDDQVHDHDGVEVAQESSIHSQVRTRKAGRCPRPPPTILADA
jgi:hypothetical protein